MKMYKVTDSYRVFLSNCTEKEIDYEYAHLCRVFYDSDSEVLKLEVIERVNFIFSLKQ